MSPKVAAVRRLRRRVQTFVRRHSSTAEAEPWKQRRPLLRDAGILAGAKPDTGWLRVPRIGRGLRASPSAWAPCRPPSVRSAFKGHLERESNPRQLDYKSSALPD